MVIGVVFYAKSNSYDLVNKTPTDQQTRKCLITASSRHGHDELIDKRVYTMHSSDAKQFVLEET